MRGKGGAAAFILNGDSEVLLVKHAYGRLNWELPGGRSEDNESPAETAVREVFEETGMTVAAHHMTGHYYDTGSDSLHFVFWCEPEGDAAPKPNRTEISECRYWSLEALPRPISDWTVRRIQDALAGNAFGLPVRIGERVWLEDAPPR